MIKLFVWFVLLLKKKKLCIPLDLWWSKLYHHVIILKFTLYLWVRVWVRMARVRGFWLTLSKKPLLQNVVLTVHSHHRHGDGGTHQKRWTTEIWVWKISLPVCNLWFRNLFVFKLVLAGGNKTLRSRQVKLDKPLTGELGKREFKKKFGRFASPLFRNAIYWFKVLFFLFAWHNHNNYIRDSKMCSTIQSSTLLKG